MGNDNKIDKSAKSLVQVGSDLGCAKQAKFFRHISLNVQNVVKPT